MKEINVFVESIQQVTPFRAAAGAVDGVRMTDKGTFIFDPNEEITAEVVQDFIKLHKDRRLPKLLESHYMYLGQHEQLVRLPIASQIVMPHNRLVVNFPKYIVDTYNGYFIGIPIKISNKNDSVTERIQEFVSDSDLNDNFAEISKMCAIYGSGFAFMYQNSDGDTQLTYNSPLDMFAIYDDTIQQNQLAGVRFWEENRKGEVYTKGELYMGAKRYIYSEKGGKITLEEDESDVYEGDIYQGRCPIIEFVENDDRHCVFESVKTLINEFNKALSEKANDVEYFANAYLKILGAKVENGTMTVMQANRVINAVGTGAQQVDVGFLGKPDADATAEHLLDRLMDLIFIIAMVANTTDDTYGNASGTALEFKLQDMRNMSIAKERKFTSSLRNVFRLWSGVPLQGVDKDSWKDNTYIFTENIPRNVKEEIENAKALEGIVTKETQLSQLSFIDNVSGELEALDKEKKEAMEEFAKQIPMNGQQNPNDTQNQEQVPTE